MYAACKLEFLLTSIQYYNLQQQAITDYEPDYRDNEVVPIKLVVESYKRNSNGTMAQYTEKRNYSLTLLNPYGPFGDSLPKVKDRLQALVRMEQSFSLTDTGMLADFGLTEFRWDLVIVYESDGGRIGLELDLSKVCAVVAQLLMSFRRSSPEPSFTNQVG